MYIYIYIYIYESRWVERNIDTILIRAEILASNYFRAGGKTDNKG